MNVVALAGGVGGAKLAEGLYQVLPPYTLTVIVNTGDDFEHLGLHISPDVDTLCYTLAGLANPETGWGRAEESWNALEGLTVLGGPNWFRLGDKDLGTHLERTRRLRAGERLSIITAAFCKAWGVRATVLPMSDQRVATLVDTEDGELAFQDYFVARRCEPRVRGFRFEGIEEAEPAQGVIEAINQADLVAIAPSNPWVSVAPLLGVRRVREALAGQCVVAVSPIIGGTAVKGPAAKMYAELDIEPSALAVAEQYGELLSGFVLDEVDGAQVEAIERLGIMALATRTLMKSAEDRRRLAGEVIEFGRQILGL